MRGKTTIVINGRHYDAKTGLIVNHESSATPRQVGNDFAKPASKLAAATPKKITVSHDETPKAARSKAPATAIHGTTQRSQTLVRSAVKKPVSHRPVEHRRERAVVSKSPHITRFAPHPQPIEKKVELPMAGPAPQPKYHRAHAATTNAMPTKQISSRAIKEHLISEQLENAPAHHHREHTAPIEPSRGKRAFSLASAALALILLGGYLTYLNMPSLSIRVAAAQAGIDATLPEYHPDGYRFNGPVAYSHGEVDMTYSANAGPQSYTISQKASDWDSQAVLDNFVMKESSGDYNIHSTQGLTVYTFNNKAAWVNNGILHTIDYGEAPLSYNQIERIASSM